MMDSASAGISSPIVCLDNFMSFITSHEYFVQFGKKPGITRTSAFSFSAFSITRLKFVPSFCAIIHGWQCRRAVEALFSRFCLHASKIITVLNALQIFHRYLHYLRLKVCY